LLAGLSEAVLTGRVLGALRTDKEAALDFVPPVAALLFEILVFGMCFDRSGISELNSQVIFKDTSPAGTTLPVGPKCLIYN
jgi:hypothetical protein